MRPAHAEAKRFGTVAPEGCFQTSNLGMDGLAETEGEVRPRPRSVDALQLDGKQQELDLDALGQHTGQRSSDVRQAVRRHDQSSRAGLPQGGMHRGQPACLVRIPVAVQDRQFQPLARE